MTKEEKTKFVIENQNLVRGIANNYANLNPSYDADDLFQVGMHSFYKKIDLFDKSRSGSFTTFITTCVRNDIIKYLKKEKKHIRDVDELTYKEIKQEDNESDFKLFIDDMLRNMKKSEQTVISMKIEGYNYKEITEKTGIPYRKSKKVFEKFKRKVKQEYA